MNVTAQKFQSQYALVCKSLHGATIGRHSLSHALWACQLPQRGSREGLHHSSYRPETGTLRAIFIAPTKLSILGI